MHAASRGARRFQSVQHHTIWSREVHTRKLLEYGSRHRAQMITSYCRQVPLVGWAPITGPFKSTSGVTCMHCVFSRPALHHTAHCHRDNDSETNACSHVLWHRLLQAHGLQWQTTGTMQSCWRRAKVGVHQGSTCSLNAWKHCKPRKVSAEHQHLPRRYSITSSSIIETVLPVPEGAASGPEDNRCHPGTCANDAGMH